MKGPLHCSVQALTRAHACSPGEPHATDGPAPRKKAASRPAGSVSPCPTRRLFANVVAWLNLFALFQAKSIHETSTVM